MTVCDVGGGKEAPQALKKKSLHSYASHDDYMRAQQEGIASLRQSADDQEDHYINRNVTKSLPRQSSSFTSNDTDTKPKGRKFSFYSVGLLILQFVSQEKRLQKSVAPNKAGNIRLNWLRLKRYFGENKPAPKMDGEQKKGPTMSLTVPSPEQQRRRTEYNESFDEEEHYSRNNQSFRNPRPQHDPRRRGSYERGGYDRGDDFEADDPRMWRENSRQHYDDYSRSDDYEQDTYRQGDADYGRQRSRPQRGMSRSDYLEYPHEEYGRQRSYSRSPDRSPQSHKSVQSRNHSYSPPPRHRSERHQDLQQEWQGPHSKRRDSFGNVHPQRSRNTLRAGDSRGVKIPIYHDNEDDTDDSDDFGSEDAEHLYRSPRHLSKSRSFDLDERKAKGVTFSFNPSEDPDYLYDDDSFSQLPSTQRQPSSQKSTPRTSDPRYKTNANLKSILKNSESFQDDDEFEDCDTPPPTCGGMLHRYLDTFQNIPNPDVSVFEEGTAILCSQHDGALLVLFSYGLHSTF